MLRPGSVRSNTSAARRAVLDAAIAALSPVFPQPLMVTCDEAGTSHEPIARLDKLATLAHWRPAY